MVTDGPALKIPRQQPICRLLRQKPDHKETIMSQTQRATRVGDFLGQPIYQTIESRNATYIFDRIAKNIDGEFPLDQLNKDELLIRPGLIYRPKG
jgi:hypothetical protein